MKISPFRLRWLRINCYSTCQVLWTLGYVFICLPKAEDKKLHFRLTFNKTRTDVDITCNSSRQRRRKRIYRFFFQIFIFFGIYKKNLQIIRIHLFSLPNNFRNKKKNADFSLFSQNTPFISYPEVLRDSPMCSC